MGIVYLFAFHFRSTTVTIHSLIPQKRTNPVGTPLLQPEVQAIIRCSPSGAASVRGSLTWPWCQYPPPMLQKFQPLNKGKSQFWYFLLKRLGKGWVMLG